MLVCGTCFRVKYQLLQLLKFREFLNGLNYEKDKKKNQQPTGSQVENKETEKKDE